MADIDVIASIYEAAALPELWPEVLQKIADSTQAAGAALIERTPGGTKIISSPHMQSSIDEFIAEGWATDTEHSAPLFAELYPGFRAEIEYRTVEEMAQLPVHREFFIPRGLSPGAGSILQGARDDSFQIAVQGFKSHEAAKSALPWLDSIRAPLARSISLSAQIRRSEAATAIAALDLAGVSAAVVSPDGTLRAINDRFATRLGNRIAQDRSRLRFSERSVRNSFADCLKQMGPGAKLRSIAVPATLDHQAAVLHLLPLRLRARDVFEWDGILVLLAEPANTSLPGADLLRLLFDLTPSEARLTRLLIEGYPIPDAAVRIGISRETARTHLRSIFSKVGVGRQSELTRLLLGLGPPY